MVIRDDDNFFYGIKISYKGGSNMIINITINVDEENLENPKVEVNVNKDKDIKPNVSNYARYFDDSCAGWNNNAEYNLLFVKQQQAYANELLRSKGYLFLNDVYDMLGIARTKEGQIVGWVYKEENPIGDNCVDFGIYTDFNRNFINGYEKSILLDFNVDGNILDQI